MEVDEFLNKTLYAYLQYYSFFLPFNHTAEYTPTAYSSIRLLEGERCS